MRNRIVILTILLTSNFLTVNANAKMDPALKEKIACTIERYHLSEEYDENHRAKYEEWKKQIKRRYDVARSLAEVASFIQAKLHSNSSTDKSSTKRDDLLRGGLADLVGFNEEINTEWAYLLKINRFNVGGSHTRRLGDLAIDLLLNDLVYLERVAPAGYLNTDHDYVGIEDRLPEDYEVLKNTTVLAGSSKDQGLETCYFDQEAKRSFGLLKRNCVVIDLASDSDIPQKSFEEYIKMAGGLSHLVVSAKSDETIRSLDILERILFGSHPESFSQDFFSREVNQSNSLWFEHGPGITADSKYPWATCQDAPLSFQGYLQCAASRRCGSFYGFTIAEPKLDRSRARFLFDLVGLQSVSLDSQGDSSESSGKSSGDR